VRQQLAEKVAALKRLYIFRENQQNKSKHATREWQLKVRYCRERGAYLRITDRASLGVGD
jgi:hypothetical protein